MSTTELQAAGPVIAAATSVGPVALTTSDLPRLRAFYETVLGLRATELPGGDTVLGAPDGPALIRLQPDPDAARLDPRAPGLFHVALLLPSRRDLAHALLRIAVARWPLSGASDHLVSEALYLRDPEGNGIELYRDRGREDWPRDPSGRLEMATLALDLDDLLGEVLDTTGGSAPPAADPHAPAETRVGHVHLQVADIPATEAFYHGLLGFEVMARSYPGALFVSAGGYHHHLGLNTWNSAGAARPVPGAQGLRWCEVAVPDRDELTRVQTRLESAGVALEPGRAGEAEIRLHDPSGNAIHLRAA